MGKRLQPKLRFKGFTDDWEQHKLGSLGTSYSGLSGKDKTDFGHGSGSYITYLNVFQNPIADIDGTDRIEIDPKQNTVHYGDVFFTVSSETPEEVGMSSVWLGNQQNIYLNSFCFGYRQNGTFDTKYLAYMLRSRSIRNRMKVLAQGISRFNISQRRVMDIEVSFPSMGEQQKIGVLCGKLDQLIDAEKRKLNLLQKKKTALLRQIFDQKLRFIGYSNSWKQSTLEDVASLVKKKNTGNVVSIVYTNSASNGVIPQLSYYNHNVTSNDNLDKYTLIECNDFVYNPRISSDAPYGPIRRNGNTGTGIVSPLYTIFRIKHLDPFFVEQYFMSHNWHRFMYLNADTGARSDRFSIKDSTFLQMPITYPDQNEQKRIGKLFQMLESLIAAETRKNDLLMLKKKALLQQMFI